MAINKAHVRNLSDPEFCDMVTRRKMLGRGFYSIEDVIYLLECAVERLAHKDSCNQPRGDRYVRAK